MNILYFPRKYNDTDNIVPILYLLLENRKSIDLYVYNLRDDDKIFRDPNIRFIKEAFPTRVKCCSKKQSYIDFIRSSFKRLYLSSKQRKKTIAYKTESLAELVRTTPFQLAIFDHTKDGRYVAQADYLRDKHVQTVSLPHGIRVTLNQLRTKTDLDLNEKKRRIEKQFNVMKCFDRIFYNDKYYLDQLKHLCKDRALYCKALDKIKCLGSLRYSKYWLGKKELFETPYPWGNNKRKVLIFPTKPEKNTHWEEFIIALKMMNKSNNVSYIVKPFHGMNDQIPAHMDNIMVTDRHSSSSLIQSADVVMFWATSVVFEALERKKPCIYLSYLHSNHTMFDLHDAAWKIQNRDQLNECLDKLDDPDFDCSSMVSDVARDKLLREVVYNGNECLEECIAQHLNCFDALLEATS